MLCVCDDRGGEQVDKSKKVLVDNKSYNSTGFTVISMIFSDSRGDDDDDLAYENESNSVIIMLICLGDVIDGGDKNDDDREDGDVS